MANSKKFFCLLLLEKSYLHHFSKIKSHCAAGFALLNLPKGKSLGRSKPETNSSNEQAH
jgi:hypothetical protein